MSQKFQLPGYYRILSAQITPFGSRNAYDVAGIIHKLIVEESIEKDSMRGFISVIDGVGLLEKFPLRGEERLSIEVEDVLGQKKIYDFFIYKVENVTAKGVNDALSYDLHFVSYMRWNAGKHRIIQSFGRSIRTTAEEIFKKYYSPFTKPFITDSTEGDFPCIIPNYTPQQALSFLASRAYNSISPSCSFRFFENSEAFYFVPDEYLIADAASKDNIKEFTFNPYIPAFDTGENGEKSGYDVESHMRNLKSLQNSDRINTVKDLYSGAYRNNPIVIDFVNKKVTDNRYSYQDSKKNFFTLSNNNRTVEDVHSEGFIDFTFNEENERKFLVFKDYQSAGDLPTSIRGEQYLPQIISNRLAYRHMLYRNTIYVTANGRVDLKAGDIVKLFVPQISANSDKSGYDSQLTGNYIVHDCTHSFDKEVYEISMMLTKFDWRSQ